jgi:parallel beta-helix repeat protein
MRHIRFDLIVLVLLFVLVMASPGRAQGGTTYYISSSDGSDSYNGLTPSTPFATVARANSLALVPGDQVLFKCGDTWQADPLIITRSGSAAHPITFGSYPAGCANQPVLSGSRPVAGWSLHAGLIYVADLDEGANAGRFPNGINQLFRDGERLTLGRWPNLDAGDGGYSTIDSQPTANRITDNQLPAGDWSGAVAHIRGMRWYILNRAVTGDSGNTLTLGADADCWAGSCAGWGYFLNNHLEALDRDGEWYYDEDTHRLYLYSASGAPGGDQVEASVVLADPSAVPGGVVLGEHLYDEISYVVVENLEVRNWYLHGFATPVNLKDYENSYLTLRDNTIADVDGDGIHLATWVWEADDGASGWRGGNHLTVTGNLIDGANHKGIDSYAKQSTFAHNTIRAIGLVENLNASGLGCSLTASGGACTEDGDGIRIKVDKVADSGHTNTIRYNRLEKIAYNGMDIFGPNHTIEYNVIDQACYTKGDCGGVRTFGGGNLASTPVHDLTFRQNIILDTLGNTDGCHTTYDPLFGFGLYIDNYSRDVTITGNTIISSTVAGILYQRSTGRMTDNTLYNNSRGSMVSAQVTLGDSVTQVPEQRGNVLYSLNDRARTLSLSGGAGLSGSDYNYFFNPYLARHIAAGGNRSLAEWRAYSGQDIHSVEHWFTLDAGDPPRSRVFYNAAESSTNVDLGGVLYLDLDQNPVVGSLSLSPFSSQVLVASDDAADLTLAMEALSGSDTFPGAPLTYTLTITNQGTQEAGGVVLTHTLPAEIVDTVWAASPSLASAALQPGSRYVWSLPDLSPGAGGVFTLTGRYTDTLEAGDYLTLEARASTADPEVSTRNNAAQLVLGTWKAVYLPLVVK